MSDNSSRYARTRNELLAWPYTVHQIRDTLDVDLIEARGKQLLFQAINTENLTAFLGSGAAAAYGRHSWTTWRNTQIRVVEEHAERFLEVAEASLKLIKVQLEICDPNENYEEGPFRCALKRMAYRAKKAEFFDTPIVHGHSDHNAGLGMAGKRNLYRWLKNREEILTYAREEVDDLFQTFKKSNAKGEFPGGESLPVQFEIAQQLHSMLRSHAGLYLPSNVHGAGMGHAEAKNESVTHCTIGLWAEADSSTAPIKAISAFLNIRKELPDKPGGEFYELLRLTGEFRNAHENYLQEATKPQAYASFNDLTKLLLLDEAALAEFYVDSALTYGKKNGRGYQSADIKRAGDFWDERRADFEKRRRNLRRDILGIRQDSELYKCMAFYRVTDVLKIVELAKAEDIPGWDDALEEIRKHCETIHKDRGRIFLTPSIRFLVGVLLRLIRDPFASTKLKEVFEAKVGPSDFTSRDSILAPHLDPVRKLALDMNIRRYLTTNYDFEIERFFQDIGYDREIRTQDRASHQLDNRPPPMAPDDPRSNGLGRVMRDMTFRRESASDLFRFATGADGADVSVFHLHGRATNDDRIVVTERDYMELYLREDRERDLVDEGIRLAFSANPILFLGLGMTEADVLRPLRQFMSNHDRAIPHRSIVLMPAEKSKNDRAKTSAGLYLRYGTHTLFYGMAVLEVDNKGERKEQTVDWMHQMLSVISKLWDINNDSLKNVQNGAPPILGPVARTKVETLLGANSFVLEQFFEEATFVPRDVDLVIGQDIEGRDRISVNTKDYFAVTFKLLGNVVKRTLTQGSEVHDPKKLIRGLQACLALLDGLRSAIFTSCFNAALDGLHKEWGTWWKQWQQSPPHRLARFEELDLPKKGNPEDKNAPSLRASEFPRRFVRHSVLSTMSDNLWLRDERKFPNHSAEMEPTRYFAFDQFVEAVRRSIESGPKSGLFVNVPGKDGLIDQKLIQGRRLYTVAAERGLGKGAFMSAFTSDLGLANYLHAAWPTEFRPRPLFVNASFVNLSFGTEIASIYDMLLDVFFQATICLQVAKDEDGRESVDHFADCSETLAHADTSTYVNVVHARERLFENNGGSIRVDLSESAENLAKKLRGLSRSSALLEVTRALRKASAKYAKKTERQPRVLLVIQSAELLYYHGGLCKNREIDQIIRFLTTSPESAHLPLDMVVVGNENALGEPWRSGPRKKAINKVKAELSHSNIPVTRKGWKAPPAHFIRAENGKSDRPDAARFEAELARSIQSDMIALRDDSTKLRVASDHQIHFAQPMRPEQFLVDNFPTLAVALFANEAREFFEGHNLDRSQDSESNDFLDEPIEVLREALREADESFRKQKVKQWRASRPPDASYGEANREYRKDVKKALGAFVEATQVELGGLRIDKEHLFNDPRLGPRLNELGSWLKDGKGFSSRLEDRYGSTLSVAAREWESIQNTLGGNRFSFTILLAAAEQKVLAALRRRETSDDPLGAKHAEKLIRGIGQQVASASADQRERYVLREVLDEEAASSNIGDPDRDHRLHMLIIKHLAVIGAPVSCNVLVRTPDIRDYLDQTVKDGEISRRRHVARAVFALAERGLVFRLSPHPRLARINKGPDSENLWPTDVEYRYAVHRSVQSLVIGNLGNEPAEPGSINSFAPSLYASMPSNLPRFRADGYMFLNRLVQSLSQYPDQPHRRRVANSVAMNADDPTTPVQALRAALSTVRTTYSISVVSRLEQEITPSGDATEDAGFFENYKINLRWLIRKAWEFLDNSEKGGEHFDRAPERKLDQLNALYRDEIVWLYNETGLTCLVQGNLADAVALLRQAIHLNRGIEGQVDGQPQHNRISLNLAICQIERGRLDAARRRLSNIVRSEAVNHSTERVHALARLYRGLISHLTGDRQYAQQDYEYAEAGLRALEDRRGSAIALFHHANLLRDMKKEKEGNRKMTEAIGFAEAGGHEDIRRRLQLTDCYHRLFLSDPSGNFKDFDALRRLRNIEEYAQRFGCANLMTDTLLVRAQVLIGQGETSSAGKLLTSAAGLAKRYSMTLRLNRVLTEYARCLYHRERTGAAITLAKSSLAMAKRTTYRLEMERIQRLLDKIEAGTETP